MSEKKVQSKTKTEQKNKEVLEQLLSQPKGEIESLESLLKKLPPEDQKEAWRILYGDLPETIVIPEEIQKVADYKDFEITAYKFHAAKEQRRSRRIVRIAVIQNQIIEPTSAAVEDQFQHIIGDLVRKQVGPF